MYLNTTACTRRRRAALCFQFVRASDVRNWLSQAEIFGLFVAALGHDVGHPGINNNYMIATGHDLAIRYNDASPLENMHAATVFSVMKDAEMDVMALVEKPEQRRTIRATIIHTILGTDMKHHFNLISKLQEAREMYPRGPAVEGQVAIPFFVEDVSNKVRLEYLGGSDSNADGKRMLMLELILHAADIGNPARPLRSCKMWAERVMEEFYDQGDKEREHGLPVTFDRNSEKACLWRVQFNFINFIVAPLYVELIYWFPSMLQLGDSVVENHAHWLQRGLSKVLAGGNSGDAAALKKQHEGVKNKFDTIVDSMQASGWYSIDSVGSSKSIRAVPEE